GIDGQQLEVVEAEADDLVVGAHAAMAAAVDNAESQPAICLGGPLQVVDGDHDVVEARVHAHTIEAWPSGTTSTCQATRLTMRPTVTTELSICAWSFRS